MAICEVHEYSQLEDNDVHYESRRRRHIWAVCCSVISVGLVLVVFQIAPGDLSVSSAFHERGLPMLQTQTSSQDQSGAVSLANMQHGVVASRLPQPAKAWQFAQPAKIWSSMQPTTPRQVIKPLATASDTATAALEAAAFAVTDQKEVLPSSDSTFAPGLAEDPHFKCDESVAVWKDFQRHGAAPALDNFRESLSIASSIATQGPGGIVYSLAHGVRTGYFAANAALGTLPAVLGSAIQNNAQNTMSGEGAIMGEGNEDVELDGLGWELGVQVLSNLLLETAMCFQQDYKAINNDLYKVPWDIYTPGHRQSTPQYAAQQTARFIEESIATLGRAARGGRPEDIGIWLNSPLYPDYYKNNFHYQTDGWMASGSAKVYETSTETLFLGRQDSMQRLSLIPLRNVAGANNGSPRILEIAAGTGRFATFMRDNHPTAEMTIVDLSPFYLEAARENDEYWRKMRYPDSQTRPPPAKFVQAAAEKLPFEDASFDAVVCVYLFHEMPEAERAAAAAEMARVVAPGGTVVITDSQQLGDRPSLDGKIGNFAKLNEPHYQNYISTYLPDLYTTHGLTCEGKWVESSTKCLSFRKPAS